MSRRAGRRGRAAAGLATAALLLSALILGAPAASAAATAGEPAAAEDGAALTAQALRSSPLYIDPNMAWIFPPAGEKQVKAALAKSAVPVFVIAVPFDIDDDQLDYASYYLQQVYQALQRRGVYLAIGPSGDIYDAEYYVPRAIDISFSAENVEQESASAFDHPGQVAANTPGRVVKLVKLVNASPADSEAAGPPDPMYTAGEFATPDSSGGAGAVSGDGEDSAPAIAAGLLSFLFIGPLLVLLGLFLAGRGRRMAANRRGWGDSGDPGTPVGRMPAAPSTSWLLRHARGELAELERMISAGDADNPGWPQACDAYDAGLLTLDSDPEQLDLVGAIVLARGGRLALQARTGRPPAPCLVNPLHGWSTTNARGNSVPLKELTRALHLSDVPSCAACGRTSARAPRANLSPLRSRVLRVEHEGKRVPYVNFDSVWRDTKFGASRRSLPQAVREHLGVS